MPSARLGLNWALLTRSFSIDRLEGGAAVQLSREAKKQKLVRALNSIASVGGTGEDQKE